MGSRTRHAPWQRAVAQILLAASLSPTGPLLGSGLPFDPAGTPGHASTLAAASEWVASEATQLADGLRESATELFASREPGTHPASGKASIEGEAPAAAFGASPEVRGFRIDPPLTGLSKGEPAAESARRSSSAAAASSPPAPRSGTPFNRRLFSDPDLEAAGQLSASVRIAQVQDPSDPLGQRERPVDRTKAPATSAPSIPPPPTPPDFSLARGSSASRGAVRRAGAVPPSGQPAVSVPVLPSWNLLSISWQPEDPSPAAVLAPVAGSFGGSSPSTPATRRIRGRSGIRRDPGTAATSTAFTPSDRLLARRAEELATLPEAGPEPTTTSIPLCLGWNLIGYPASTRRGRWRRRWPRSPASYLRLFGFDPDRHRRPVGGLRRRRAHLGERSDQELRPGRGYWIYVTEATTLVVSNDERAAPTSRSSRRSISRRSPARPRSSARCARRRSPSWTLAFRADGRRGLAAARHRHDAGRGRRRSAPSTRRCSRTASTRSACAAVDTALERTSSETIDAQSSTASGRSATSRSPSSISRCRSRAADPGDPRLRQPAAGIARATSATAGSSRCKAGSYRTNRPTGDGWKIAAGFLPCDTAQEREVAPDSTVKPLRPRDLPLPPGADAARAGRRRLLRDRRLRVRRRPGARRDARRRSAAPTSSGRSRQQPAAVAPRRGLFDPPQVRLTTRDGRAFEVQTARPA